MKYCRKCKTTKELSEFSINRSNPSGRQSICKVCKREIDIKWLMNNPNYHKKYYIVRCLKKKGKAPPIRSRSTNNAQRKLKNCMKVGINTSLRRGSKAGRRWEDLAGYTVLQLKKHLEKHFLPGMTWENYGTVWHIDHKIPIAAFNFEKPEDMDFKKCWTLKNLQPLWAKENLSKQDRVESPFQPSLTI